jgi:uncharacterized protein (TIGR02271 family)
MASLGDKLQDLKNTITGEHQPGRWEVAAPRYRTDWEQRYGTAGGRWEEAEPAYRYGWEQANNRLYHNRTWTQAEPELRREWEGRKGRPGWDQARGWAREAWNRTIELREEQLRAVKDTRETGAVTVNKEVVTEQKTVDVPVTHEEVVIERHPVQGRPASGEIKPEGEEIRVPVQEEQARLEKQTVVTEELQVGKRPVTETEHLTDTVRREELRVGKEGNPRVRDTRKEPPTRR